MRIVIRAETQADAPAIEAVIAAAFLNAPYTSHTEQHIVSELRRVGKLALSLVAQVDGAVIAHAALSPVTISDGSEGWFGLGPVAVLEPMQRRGVGSALVREALRLLRERGACGCVVLGEPEYYARFGFRVDSALVLADVPPEYFQALSLDSSKARGIVTYHEAFAAQRCEPQAYRARMIQFL